ncbi:hypothetical protein B9Z55_007759 [Caenorhabditis nigoni]|uniref:Tc1-like transposase DDE domain-containing protein n=1 Tax=Caenorhabditis nigoni TaxID=1611254 RepID=A0A2G5VB62_9PELO|nr:hypothetical protein B9Z55_007759 [Caenorhabditis nigoni]
MHYKYKFYKDKAARKFWVQNVGVQASSDVRDASIDATEQQASLSTASTDPTKTSSPSSNVISSSSITTTPLSTVSPSVTDPDERFKDLTKTETMYIRIGKALCGVDPTSFPKIPTQKYTRNSGEEIVRNVEKVVGIVKEALGDDSRHTIFSNVALGTSQICGVHKSTIFRTTPERSDPPRKRLRDMGEMEKCRRYVSQIDLIKRLEIIKKIHSLWKEKEDVVVDDLWKWAKSELNFPRGRTIFLKTMKGMGFCYKKSDYNSVVVERPDIIQRRVAYLRLKLYWDSKNALYASYDETWAHSGMVKFLVWQHRNGGMYKRCSLMDLESAQVGPEKGKGRGKRVIIAAVLTEFGVLEGSELLLISGLREEDQKADYHADMDGANFEKYYQTMIPLFAAEAKKCGRPPVFLCDNAPYHNAALKKPPTSTSSRSEIVQFLTEHNVKFFPKQTKDLLYDICKDFIEANGGREAFTVYKFDSFAASHGVTVLRLPPYHCFFNPVELLWSQMKRSLQKTGRSEDSVEIVRSKASAFLKSFSGDSAKKLFLHTQKMEQDIREMMEERSAQDNDELFELRYDLDEDGRMYNIRIDSDDDDCMFEEEVDGTYEESDFSGSDCEEA